MRGSCTQYIIYMYTKEVNKFNLHREYVEYSLYYILGNDDE